MRKFIVIASSLVLISCINQVKTLDTDEPKTIIVSGKIENGKGKVIQFISTEFVGKDIVSDVVDGNNEYSLKIPIYHYHDVQVEFDDKRFFLLAAPGDSMRIDIDGSGSILYSGNKAKINQDILLLQQSIDKLKQQSDFYHRDDELEPSEYKQFIFQFNKKGDSIINLLTKQNIEAESVNWIKCDFTLECISELYDFVLDEQKGNVEPEFFEDISDFKFDVNYAKSNSRFYSEYINLYYSIISNERIPDEIKKTFGKLYYNMKYAELIELYRSNLHKYLADIPPIYKDLLFAQGIYRLSDKDIQVVDSFLVENPQTILDKMVNGLLLSKIDEKKLNMQDYKSLGDLQKHPVVGEIFEQLSQKAKNKVVYIDFWGTWCSKCYLEFPYSSKLEEDLKSLNIEFVYICLPPFNENKWNKTIEEYKLGGNHIVLNKEQAKIINSIFNFSGAPRYMIINTKGEFIDENAMRPHSEEIKHVLTNLAKS